MKADSIRLKRALAAFPKVPAALEKLDAAEIAYVIGGSVALYVQGHSRPPHDVDILFTNEAHDKANAVFGLVSEVIERPNVSMRKSTPVDDGSLDFLSHYTVIADGVEHYYPPIQKVLVPFADRKVNLIPAEKIVAIKLIGRREHHHDLADVTELLKHPDFDQSLFWKMVDLLDARSVVTTLLKANGILLEPARGSISGVI